MAKHRGYLSYVSSILIVVLALPRPGWATGTSAAGSPAFAALVGTIALVNRTMEEASLNPMDDRKRRNVQYAVSLLPAAIAGLALEYKQVKIDPKTFPAVRAMLGGFVDVGAPDRYKAFFQRPDRSLIPQVGEGFPREKLKNVTASPEWQQMEATVATAAPSSAGEARGTATGYGYDDNRSKDAARPENVKKTSEAAPLSAPARTSQIQGLLRDLAGVEKEAAKKTVPYAIPLKPKFWNLVPLSKLLPIPSAHAEATEEEKQLGSQIAEILMGVAAIITAIAPMVVAGIQASADVSIAKINADTTMKTAQLQADTSKYLANTQKDVALKQAQISQDISEQNNDAQTQRLNMQLVELRTAREDAQRSENEKRRIEQDYNRERIELAKKQAEDNLKLAKATLNSNLVQAGLVSGAKAMNSANELSVQETRLPPRSGVSGVATLGSAGQESSQRLLASLTRRGDGNALDAGLFGNESKGRSSYTRRGRYAVDQRGRAREVRRFMEGRLATGSNSRVKFRVAPDPSPAARARAIVYPVAAVREEPVLRHGHRP